MNDMLTALIAKFFPVDPNSVRIAYDEGVLFVTPDTGDPYQIVIPDEERKEWMKAWCARLHSWIGIKEKNQNY